jgi:hypothetical protein
LLQAIAVALPGFLAGLITAFLGNPKYGKIVSRLADLPYIHRSGTNNKFIT